MYVPSIICRCLVMMSSVMRCWRCILCNRSPLRRSSYDSTRRSPCNAILSASSSCTRHISDSNSRSVSESKRFGRFCDKECTFYFKNLKLYFSSLVWLRYSSWYYVFQSHGLLPDRVQFVDCLGPERNVPFLFVFNVTQIRPRLVHVQLIVIRKVRIYDRYFRYYIYYKFRGIGVLKKEKCWKKA